MPGNVTARLDAYDADEPGTGTGSGVKLTRGAATTCLPSASATLTGGETVTTCFQTTIR